MPGEWYAPTQPFVTKPPAFDRQGVSIDDLIDFTPELRAEAVELVKRYKIGPLFTPPVVSNGMGPLGTLMLPVEYRRHELAGRRARSGNESALHLLVHEHRVDRAHQRSRAVRHGLRPGPRARSQGAAARRRDRRRWRRRRGRRRRDHRAGAAAGQAAVRPDHGDRSEQGRPLSGRCRTATRRTSIKNHRGAEGTDDPAHRTREWPHRHAGHQVAGHRRRAGLRDDAERPRRDAACVRQGRRARTRAPSTCRRRRPDRP